MSQALLMTESDDFNALAAFELRLRELGSDRVFRLPPEEGAGWIWCRPMRKAGSCSPPQLTFAELGRRFEAGATIVELTARTRPRIRAC